VAGDNARRLGVTPRVLPVVADLAEPFDLADIDLVVANIPYVEDGTVAHLSRDVRDYEPRLALVGGPDGLDVLRRLLAQLRSLRAGAWVALEFGFAQEDAVLQLVESSGAFVEPTLHRDLAGIVRDVVFRRRP
jgi:release factor glutamine methyltransferase